MFQLWSDKNNEAKTLLSPTLDLRDWNNLPSEEKEKIWNYIKVWFEPPKEREPNYHVYLAVLKLNDLHKFQSYAKHTLENRSPSNAFKDFKDIFFKEHRDVVIELLSCFALAIIKNREGKSDGIYRNDYDSDEKYKEVVFRWTWLEFDQFADRINDLNTSVLT